MPTDRAETDWATVAISYSALPSSSVSRHMEVGVGQVWRRTEGSERRVHIGRVWSSSYFCGGGDFVRCHPVRGGTVWCTTIEEFLKRYEQVHDD